eukprot:gene42578-57641_t
MGSSVSVLATQLDNVDPMLYELCGETVIKGSGLFIESERARKAFIQYFNKGSWKKKLGEQHTLLKDAFDSIKGIPINTYSDYVFALSPPSKVAIQPKLKSIDYSTDVSKYLDLEDVRQKMKCILLAAVFPLFLESADYSNYLDVEEKKTDLFFILKSKISPGKQFKKYRGVVSRVDRL